MTPRSMFPPSARLRVSAQFQATFADGRRLSGSCFRLHASARAEPGEPRLGITVSKRVDKRAVGRNRIKRQARECFRQMRHALPPGDYVVLAKPEASKASNAQLRAELELLFNRARTLNPLAATGTMPGSSASVPRPSSSES